MNENEENLDLLDLEEDADLSDLPESSPFTSPRPKKPWLLMGIGLLVIVIATYIIIRTIGSDSGSSVEVNLDTPEVATVETNTMPTPVVPNQPAAPAVVTTAPVVVSAPVAVPVKPAVEPVHVTPGVPVREVTDRKEVTFNPNVSKPAPLPVIKPKPAPVKHAAVASGSWYVQFGSYATRSAAEVAQKKIAAKHSSLFGDKQFVILAAVLPNGSTTYRLRIAFENSVDANGFCRNAKSDGLECYVAR